MLLRIREYAGNTAVFEARCDALTAEMNAIAEQTQNIIRENASVVLDQKVYAERYSRLVADYDSKKAEYDSFRIEIAGKKAREVQIKHFIETIRELGETVTEFENGLFGELVDFITVYKDKSLKVTFKDGTEILTRRQNDRRAKKLCGFFDSCDEKFTIVVYNIVGCCKKPKDRERDAF